jgi:hypothetical protein
MEGKQKRNFCIEKGTNLWGGLTLWQLAFMRTNSLLLTSVNPCQGWCSQSPPSSPDLLKVLTSPLRTRLLTCELWKTHSNHSQTIAAREQPLWCKTEGALREDRLSASGWVSGDLVAWLLSSSVPGRRPSWVCLNFELLPCRTEPEP